MSKKNLVVLSSLVSLTLLFSGCASKQATAKKFPTKQITLVVQANPGGLSDQVSRTLGDIMQKDFGSPVICVYKAGGSGAVGLSFVKGSTPDGYTIGHAPVEISMLKSLGYTDIGPDDFTLIGLAYKTLPAITVQADSPWKTIEDFITYAKNNPGKLKMGTAGTGSIWDLASIGFEDKAGIKTTHVPFDGAAPSIAALMGGHVDVVVSAPNEVLSGTKGGKLRVLAVMGDKRSSNFPDVPTLQEKGIDYTLAQWGGFVAPKNLPADVKAALEKSFEKAVKSDDFKKFTSAQGIEVNYMSSTDFQSFAKAQSDLLGDLINKAGIKK